MIKAHCRPYMASSVRLEAYSTSPHSATLVHKSGNDSAITLFITFHAILRLEYSESRDAPIHTRKAASRRQSVKMGN